MVGNKVFTIFEGNTPENMMLEEIFHYYWLRVIKELVMNAHGMVCIKK